MYLAEHSYLLDPPARVPQLLELLSEKVMKQKETNEVLGIKFHYLAYVIRQAEAYRSKHDSVDGWIKR